MSVKMGDDKKERESLLGWRVGCKRGWVGWGGVGGGRPNVSVRSIHEVTATAIPLHH
jgi:hypothetical protein